MCLRFLFALLPLIVLSACNVNSTKGPKKLLIFSKTDGFRHTSIEPGRIAIAKLASEHGFEIDSTEDASWFVRDRLDEYAALIFLNTTLDVLDDAQQLTMQRYIQAGGGFVGIHAAADTEYDWPWYGQLVGAYFNGHPSDPNVRDAEIDVLNHDHISCKHLPERWFRTDEWYNYRNIQPDLDVLLNLDESSYEGGTNGSNHPIAWYHDFEGGRAFYTGGGHTDESFSEEAFLKHLWGGITYAAGEGRPLNYAAETVIPEENRFKKIVLEDYLNEPMELEMLPDGRLLFVERRGDIRLYDEKEGKSKVVNTLPVYTGQEDGLLGLALDPEFDTNNWLYLFYSPPGDEAKQHVSRFEWKGDSIEFASEIVLLEIKTQRDECCHSAGCLEFGPEGNLFISSGDDTNPFKSDGYSPSDERPGRSPWDAQKSSSNTGDLRGKVLRIKPEPDGTYSIPEGNLFPRDGSQGRPEIYVMGCRNPYRISIDKRNGYLYWGDVGPDAGKDSIGRGPKGHDEVNQARKAGFFGWPYFNGDNKPYHEYDFATKKSLKKHDPENPVNNSPNNTGIQNLPPANPAFIWYPYDESEEFPLLGTGGRNAMAGPVFYVEDYPDNPRRFPRYYDKKLFTYDWIRGWMMSITMDEEGDLLRMEPFMPSQKFNNPNDIIMSPDGDMYMLEYGTAWFSKNPDARLVHIKYISGNREPIPSLLASTTIGASPLSVSFSGEGSADPDGDKLKYQWTFGEGEGTSSETNPKYTFEAPGRYVVRLEVRDGEGLIGSEEVIIRVGNEPPQVTWQLNGNRTFFWPGESIDYVVKVTDKEDGSIDDGIASDKVVTTINYLKEGVDINVISMGHEALAASSKFVAGKNLMDQSDCKSCHFIDRESVGPTYSDIAKKYKDESDAKTYLADKIINGGGGVWGPNAMAAHPQHSEEEVEQMVEYILSVADQPTPDNFLSHRGSFTFEKSNDDISGSYVLMASYNDSGAEGAESLQGRKLLRLRRPELLPGDVDSAVVASVMTLTEEQAKQAGLDAPIDFILAADKGYVLMKDIDLTSIGSLDLHMSWHPQYFGGGTIDVRVGSPEGRVVGSMEVPQATAQGRGIKTIALRSVEDRQDIYLMFLGNDEKTVCAISKIVFKRREAL